MNTPIILFVFITIILGFSSFSLKKALKRKTRDIKFLVSENERLYQDIKELKLDRDFYEKMYFATCHQVGDMIETIAANHEFVKQEDLVKNRDLIISIGARIKTLSRNYNEKIINYTIVSQKLLKLNKSYSEIKSHFDISEKISAITGKETPTDINDIHNLISLAETFYISNWKERIKHNVNLR